MASSIAALIAGIQPILTAIIAVPLLGERISTRGWLGFIGLSMVVTKGIGGDNLSWTLLVLCVAALIAITVGTIYQKRFIPCVELWGGSFVQVTSACVVCALYASLFETGRIEWNATVILVVI